MKTTKMILATMSLMTLTACNYIQDKEFRAERASKLYQSAMADYSAGRLDAAIAGFEKVIRADSGNASARFQLACLLQDRKQDYLGAITHYREYILLAPSGDKIKVAETRAAMCEKLWALEIIKQQKANEGSIIAKEVAEAQAAQKAAEEQLTAAQTALAELQKVNETLTQEKARLTRMLEGLRQDETEAGSKPMDVASAKSLLDEEAAGDLLKQSPDAKALFDDDADDAVPAENLASARALLAEEAETRPTGQKPVVFDDMAQDNDAQLGAKLLQSTDDALKRKKPTKAEKAKAEPEPRPEYYVVQPDDTLYKIARRFYGRSDAWKKIQEANKAIISTDARIRPGQKIKLP